MAGELMCLVVGDTTYLADDWAGLSRVVVSDGLVVVDPARQVRP